jgi:uncharacterized small protein (DUF1192 family)
MANLTEIDGQIAAIRQEIAGWEGVLASVPTWQQMEVSARLTQAKRKLEAALHDREREEARLRMAELDECIAAWRKEIAQYEADLEASIEERKRAEARLRIAALRQEIAKYEAERESLHLLLGPPQLIAELKLQPRHLGRGL